MSDLIRDVSARVIDPRFRTLHDHQIHQKSPGTSLLMPIVRPSASWVPL
ncbi:inositol monophosphatase family protein [Cutibacterium acnes JCM 18916]|nr:inositol monophosphatase family protein [Cutibacterium acnes JCM 18916]